MNRIVIALFVCGIALVRAQSGEEGEPTTISLPLTSDEWPSSEPNNPLTSAGIVRLQLQDIFLDPNGGRRSSSDTEPIQKPARGSYVIAVNPGDDCEGVFVTQAWVMTLKDTDDVEGAAPNVLYFVQQGNDWYSNEAGFLYGYDSEFCGSRNFTAEVIIGGQFVEDINDAPDVEAPEESG